MFSFYFLHFWFLVWDGLLLCLFLLATDYWDGLRTFDYNFPILVL
jgi:hypothetical protein